MSRQLVIKIYRQAGDASEICITDILTLKENILRESVYI